MHSGAINNIPLYTDYIQILKYIDKLWRCISSIVEGINLPRDKAGLGINIIEGQMPINSHRHPIWAWGSQAVQPTLTKEKPYASKTLEGQEQNSLFWSLLIVFLKY